MAGNEWRESVFTGAGRWGSVVWESGRCARCYCYLRWGPSVCGREGSELDLGMLILFNGLDAGIPSVPAHGSHMNHDEGGVKAMQSQP